MKISIVCPVLINSPTKPDNWIWLERCIHSLKKNSKENHEIIIITNNGEKVECPIEGIKQIHTIKQGQCQAVNLGVKKAQNEYVMIIDEDFIFPTNWEELIEKAFQEDCLLNATRMSIDEPEQFGFYSGYLMERGGSFMVNNCGGIMDFDEQKFEADALRLRKEEWENGFGFPLICKKSIWELVEGYDEGYDPWGSNCDSDLEYKLMLAGIMPKRWKGVLVYHFAQISGTFFPEQHGFWARNIRRFEEKWGLRRSDSPQIWACNFKIPKDLLRYKPSFAKLENNDNLI